MVAHERRLGSEPGPPVEWQPELRLWLVRGFDEARAALREPGLSSRVLAPTLAAYTDRSLRDRHAFLIETLGRWAVLADPPDHTAARAGVRRFFAPGRLRRMSGEIETIVESVLKSAEPGANLITTVADVIPARVMALLLGLAPDGSEETLAGWARAISDWIGAPYQGAFARSAEQALREMEAALRARSAPDSLWSALAATDPAGALGTCSMVLFGGLETSGSLLGTTLYALLADPEEGRRLVSEGRTAAERLVERQLAKHPPLNHVMRHATTDVRLGDARIGAGDFVVVVLSGAADGRASHLAFGEGLHYCVGAPLARSEAVALATGFANGPAMVLDPDATRWSGNRTYRRLADLRLRPAAGSVRQPPADTAG